MSDQNTGSDPYAAVITDLIRRREEIDRAIKVIEAIRNGSAFVGQPTPTSTPEIKEFEPNAAGQYLGMSIAEASKKALSARRRTMNSQEIAEDLLAGGMAFNTDDPGNTVGSVLSRRFASLGDIVKVSRGQWGLKEWYPHSNFRPKDRGAKEMSAQPDAAKKKGSQELSDVVEHQPIILDD